MYHEKEARRLFQEVASTQGVSAIGLEMVVESYEFIGGRSNSEKMHYSMGSQDYEVAIDNDFRELCRHRKLAAAYRVAVYRPWMFIEATPSP